MPIRTETKNALIGVGLVLPRNVFMVVVSVQAVAICTAPIQLFAVGSVAMALAVVLGGNSPILQLILGRKWPDPEHATYRFMSIVDGLGAMALGIIGALEAWCAVVGNRELLPALNFPRPGF